MKYAMQISSGDYKVDFDLSKINGETLENVKQDLNNILNDINPEFCKLVSENKIDDLLLMDQEVGLIYKFLNGRISYYNSVYDYVYILKNMTEYKNGGYLIFTLDYINELLEYFNSDSIIEILKNQQYTLFDDKYEFVEEYLFNSGLNEDLKNFLDFCGGLDYDRIYDCISQDVVLIDYNNSIYDSKFYEFYE